MRLPSSATRPPSPARVALDNDGWDGKAGNPDVVRWIKDGTVRGRTVGAAIPGTFEAYGVYEAQREDEARLVQQQRLVQHLRRFGAQSWWLGYLDTGVHDVVLVDTPRVDVYVPGSGYVLVQAGPQEALDWRDTLPDLIFPVDHAWLVSILWDDDHTFFGGTRQLVSELVNDLETHARPVDPEERFANDSLEPSL